MGLGSTALIDCLLSNALAGCAEHGYVGSFADTVRESA
jgi:hypothetical protein